MIRYQMALIRRSPRPPILQVNSASKNGACNWHISLHHMENPLSQFVKRWGGGGGEAMSGGLAWLLETKNIVF
jgi:hypothetical protein